jgi:hypothetical protein
MQIYQGRNLGKIVCDTVEHEVTEGDGARDNGWVMIRVKSWVPYPTGRPKPLESSRPVRSFARSGRQITMPEPTLGQQQPVSAAKIRTSPTVSRSVTTRGQGAENGAPVRARRRA